jgi:hypothetical protein
MSSSDDALNAWRTAHAEAVIAFGLWQISHDRGDYIAYRAAQDREDAAQDTLAENAPKAAA